jgi:hypothetical protein
VPRRKIKGINLLKVYEEACLKEKSAEKVNYQANIKTFKKKSKSS